jgi:hypothetical protein
MKEYDNLLEALADLKSRGFTTDFNIAFDSIACSQSGKALSPAEFEIIEHHRFEGDTDPDNSSVLYVIQSHNGSMKGVLINAYGVYSDAMSDTMIQKLKMNE